MDEQKYKDIIERLILEKEILQLMIRIRDAINDIVKHDEKYIDDLIEQEKSKRIEIDKMGDRGKLTF